MIKNLIRNIKTGQGDDTHKGFEYARKLADEHQQKTGNKCLVSRVIDYRDRFDGEIREHFSFDVIEIVNDD